MAMESKACLEHGVQQALQGKPLMEKKVPSPGPPLLPGSAHYPEQEQMAM